MKMPENQADQYLRPDLEVVQQQNETFKRDLESSDTFACSDIQETVDIQVTADNKSVHSQNTDCCEDEESSTKSRSTDGKESIENREHGEQLEIEGLQKPTEESSEAVVGSVGKAAEVGEAEEVNTCVQKDISLPSYLFDKTPQLITGAWEEFTSRKGGCYTKGAKWSPDGTCILTNSEDHVLRVFDLPRELHCQSAWVRGQQLPEMKAALRIREGGCVYDYCWYPFMSSWDPLSCCLVSATKDNPLHLWDAYTGELRCSYLPYNHLDEVENAYCVAFNASGDRLYSGFKNMVRVFNTDCPGRSCQNRSLKGCGRPVGLVSAIAVNPTDPNSYAICSYGRTIALCSEPSGSVECLLCSDGGGLTHLAFSPDGNCLYAGSRSDNQLFCWDMRNLGTVLFTTSRTVDTQQRIYFDLSPDGRYVVSGTTDGHVTVWDTTQPPQATADVPFLPAVNTFHTHDDCTNGVSLHRQYPILATSSGQRHLPDPSEEPDEGQESEGPACKRMREMRENSLKLWWMGQVVEPEEPTAA